MPNADKRIRKLDAVSLRKLTESTGPCNECICNLIVPPKPQFKIKSAVRNALDNLQMYQDSTAKLLGITSPQNLAGPCVDAEGSKRRRPSKSVKSGKSGKAGKAEWSAECAPSGPPRAGKCDKESQRTTYEELKKLDKVSLKKLRDGQGPCDECICHILSLPPDPLTFGKLYRKIRCYIRRFTHPPQPQQYDPKRKGKKKPSPKSSKTSYKGKKNSADSMRKSSKKGSKYQPARPSKNKAVEVPKKKRGGCCRNC